MSEESYQSAVAFPKLTLEIPPPGSALSSLHSSQTSSPTEILDSSATTPTDTTTTTMTSTPEHVAATTSVSCSSLPIQSQGQSLNVKFAPLPELAPRKRRSTAPLGMAARAQLVRKRRNHQHNYYDPDPGPRYKIGDNPMWTEEELAEARMRQVAVAVERERQRRSQRENDPHEEDPFMVFGRLVKDAGKHFWKIMAKKDKKEGNGHEENDQNTSAEGETATDPNEPPQESENISTPSSATILQDEQNPTAVDAENDPRFRLEHSPGSPPRLGSIPGHSTTFSEDVNTEEGRVWEEELDRDLLLSIKQATIENTSDDFKATHEKDLPRADGSTDRDIEKLDSIPTPIGPTSSPSLSSALDTSGTCNKAP